MGNEIVAIITALITAAGTYFIARSKDKTTLIDTNLNHTNALFDRYTASIQELSSKVDILEAKVDESEESERLSKEKLRSRESEIEALKAECKQLREDYERTVEELLESQKNLEVVSERALFFEEMLGEVEKSLRLSEKEVMEMEEYIYGDFNGHSTE